MIFGAVVFAVAPFASYPANFPVIPPEPVFTDTHDGEWHRRWRKFAESLQTKPKTKQEISEEIKELVKVEYKNSDKENLKQIIFEYAPDLKIKQNAEQSYLYNLLAKQIELKIQLFLIEKESQDFEELLFLM